MLLEAVYQVTRSTPSKSAWPNCSRRTRPGLALAEWLAALILAFGKAKRSLTTAMLDSELLSSCREVLARRETDALLTRAQQASTPFALT